MIFVILSITLLKTQLLFYFFCNFEVTYIHFACKEFLICNFDFLVVVNIVDFPTTNLKTCSVTKSIVVNVCCLCVWNSSSDYILVSPRFICWSSLKKKFRSFCNLFLAITNFATFWYAKYYDTGYTRCVRQVPWQWTWPMLHDSWSLHGGES
jgi:hypothetical protein